jgi:ABC-type nitrate/sulfonate/bicarbonate transport system substrate-binding protein
MDSLNVIAFAGASNWPLWAGQKADLFAAEGIDLSLELTPNSKHMARALHLGSAQIALTSVDNVIAYVAGQGEQKLDGAADFFAFMGVDDGLLSVIAQSGISRLDELRSKVLAVDALTTGYAFVLKELLASVGIGDADVIYTSVGSGVERLIALQKETCDATLLNEPLCLAAENLGKVRLLRAATVLGDYQGIVGAAKRIWASENRDILVRFIRAFHRSLEWLNDPANKNVACEILSERQPALGPAVDAAYDLLVINGGLRRSLAISEGGVERVIDLRRRYGGNAEKLEGAAAYIDDSFRSEAL